MCDLASNDREDDPMIGMLLDRYSWDEKRVCELYREPASAVADILRQLPRDDDGRVEIAEVMAMLEH